MLRHRYSRLFHHCFKFIRHGPAVNGVYFLASSSSGEHLATVLAKIRLVSVAVVEPVGDGDWLLAMVAGDASGTRIGVCVHPSHEIAALAVGLRLYLLTVSRLAHGHTWLHSRHAGLTKSRLLHRHTRLHAGHARLAITRLLHRHTRLTVTRHHSWLLHRHARLTVSRHHSRLLHGHTGLTITWHHSWLLHRHSRLPVTRHHAWLLIHRRLEPILLCHHLMLLLEEGIHLHLLLRNSTDTVLHKACGHIACSCVTCKSLLSLLGSLQFSL